MARLNKEKKEAIDVTKDYVSFYQLGFIDGFKHGTKTLKREKKIWKEQHEFAFKFFQKRFENRKVKGGKSKHGRIQRPSNHRRPHSKHARK